jgi:hypothetical protein
MKKLFTCFLSVLSLSAIAQNITWSTPAAIAGSSFGNLHPRVVLDRAGSPLVLWGNSNTKETFFSRWSGTSFTVPVAVNPSSIPVFAADWAGPDIASHGDTVYVVFKKVPETDTANHIYIVSSVNGGQNFSTPARVDYIKDSISRFPTVATDDNGHPTVAFMKFDPGGMTTSRWVTTSSANLGTVFSMDVLASSSAKDVCDCCPGALISSGANRVMLYRDAVSNNRIIWSGISTNSGGSFSNLSIDNTGWTIPTCPSTGPDGILVGDTVYSVFMSHATNPPRIYISKTSIAAGSASNANLLTGSITGLTTQNFPRIARAGTEAVAVWKQVVSGVHQVGLLYTDEITKGFSASPETVNTTGVPINADIAMSHGVIHVVWQDNSSGAVMYRKGTYASSVKQLVKNSELIYAYPNPSSNSFTIDLKNKTMRHFRFVDNAGKQLDADIQQTKERVEVNVTKYAAGVYYLMMQDTGGKLYHAEVMVSH